MPASLAARLARIRWPSEAVAWVLAGLIASGGLLSAAAPQSLLPLPVAAVSLPPLQPALPFAMYSPARRRAASPLRYGVYATAVLSQFTTGAPVAGDVIAAAVLVGAPSWRGTVSGTGTPGWRSRPSVPSRPSGRCC
ncbi:hypothetical protein ACFV2H_04535 [Streptomyces sp. NPDC059629]|uniref:hypothetical protein n=1 Tax=Streptomyces sp. NPDC059629 TaxID=3346889 RepID=UPI00367A741F